MTTTTDPLAELRFRGGAPAELKKAARRGDAAEFQRAMTSQHRTTGNADLFAADRSRP